MANKRKKPNTKGKGKFQERDRFEKDERSNDRNKYGSSRNQKKGDRSGDSPSNYSNDPAWWNRAGNLTQLATNISTEIPIGIQLETDMLQHWTPSGVLKLEYAPCFGDIDSPTHPFNVIARSLYDFINSRNSRSSQYDPSDLILYIISVANAWSLHAWVRRIVGMYNTFSPMNRYWWDSVLATMGVAPISQTDDIDNWVSVANKIALTLNTLAVPRDIKYFDRTQMLTSAVYADSPTSKASLYYYQPSALFKYGYDEEGKGMLTLSRTPFAESGDSSSPTRNITPQVIWTYFESLIANLLNDTDISYMKADIRRAYDDNVYTIPQIDNTFSLGAVFDGFVNLQTRNATVHTYLRDAMYTSLYKITQNMGTNSLTSTRVLDMINAHESAKLNPSIAHSYGNGNHALAHLFDFPVDDVNNDLVTEATKLHAFVSPGGHFRATCEVITLDCFYSFEYNWDTQTTSLVRTSNITTLGYNTNAPEISATEVGKMMHGLELASKYAASPMQFVVYNDSSYFYPMEGAYLIEDLTNYTTIDTEQLQDIWDAAQMSILAPFDMK